MAAAVAPAAAATVRGLVRAQFYCHAEGTRAAQAAVRLQDAITVGAYDADAVLAAQLLRLNLLQIQ